MWQRAVSSLVNLYYRATLSDISETQPFPDPNSPRNRKHLISQPHHHSMPCQTFPKVSSARSCSRHLGGRSQRMQRSVCCIRPNKWNLALKFSWPLQNSGVRWTISIHSFFAQMRTFFQSNCLFYHLLGRYNNILSNINKNVSGTFINSSSVLCRFAFLWLHGQFSKVRYG